MCYIISCKEWSIKHYALGVISSSVVIYIVRAPLLIFSMLITDTLRCTPPTTHARTTHAHNSPGASRRQLTSSKEILAQHNSPSSVHKSGLTNCESLIQSHLLILRVLTSQTSQTLPGTRALFWIHLFTSYLCIVFPHAIVKRSAGGWYGNAQSQPATNEL